MHLEIVEKTKGKQFHGEIKQLALSVISDHWYSVDLMFVTSV